MRKINSMFQASQNEQYFDEIVRRANDEYLVWVEQFLDIIEEHYDGLGGTQRLDDIGCCVGQFWKGLKQRQFDIEYYGIDVESRDINTALEIFPELRDHLIQMDITREIPDDSQITVVSATLEHLPFLYPALDHILKTTEKLVLIRTFLGEHTSKSIFMKKEASSPYYINQYSFGEILESFELHDFETKVLRDVYTDSMPKYLGQGIVRTQYLVIGNKKS